MDMVFFCQSCGARFEVNPQMAGKRGHCKKCGQSMTIPRAEEIASMAAMPALATGAVGAGTVPGGRSGAWGGSIGSVPQAGISKLGLAPITLDRMPIGRRRERERPPSPLDDAEDSKPYVLAQPIRERRGAVRSHDNLVLRAWRGQLSGIHRVFRWINETAYLISVPFIMMLLFGTVVRNRPMALLGAAVVILLNIGRLVSGAAGLVVVPLRDGLKWKKLRKPLRRLAEPALTIGLVVLAYFFIPFLSTGKPSTRGVAGRINAGLEALEKRALGELDTAKAIEQGPQRP
jgi:hypothetical protein